LPITKDFNIATIINNNNSSNNSPYYFSIYSLYDYAHVITLFRADNTQAREEWREFEEKMVRYERAVDRRLLVPIYAQVASFVKTFFGISFRMLTRVKLSEFVRYLHTIEANGVEVMFQETALSQYDQLKANKVRIPNGAKKLTRAERAELNALVTGTAYSAPDGDADDDNAAEESGAFDEDSVLLDREDADYAKVKFKMAFKVAHVILERQLKDPACRLFEDDQDTAEEEASNNQLLDGFDLMSVFEHKPDVEAEFLHLNETINNAQRVADESPAERSKIAGLKDRLAKLVKREEDEYIKQTHGVVTIRNKHGNVVCANRPFKFEFPQLFTMDNKWWVREWIVDWITTWFMQTRNYYVLGADLFNSIFTEQGKYRFLLDDTLVFAELPNVLKENRIVIVRIDDSATKKWHELTIDELLATSRGEIEELLFFTPKAFAHEQGIAAGIELLKKRAKDQVYPKEDDIIVPPEITNVHQLAAYKHAIMKPLSIIVGDGGTGKSFLMKHIVMYLAKRAIACNESYKFLFLSFKNDIVQAMRHAMVHCAENMPLFGEQRILIEGVNCAFSTLDSFAFAQIGQFFAGMGGGASVDDGGDFGGGKRVKMDNSSDDNNAIELDAVFIDESGMSATYHLYSMFNRLNHTKTVKRVIFLGDYKQLPPISNGNPFLQLVTHLPADVIELTKNFRTGFADTLKLLEDIKADNQVAIVRRFDKKEALTSVAVISYHPPPHYNRRDELNYMFGMGRKLMDIITQRSLGAGNSYDETFVISPYNDMCMYLGLLMSNHYFGDNLTHTEIHSIATKRSKISWKAMPVLHVGMRVVFKCNNAEEPTNRYSRGQLGVIEAIIDSTQDCPKITNDNYVSMLQRDMTISREKTMIDDVNTNFKKRTFIIKSRADETRKYHVEGMSSKVGLQIFLETFTIGNALTVMRAQGQGFQHVILALPVGTNLVTRKILYTGASRAMETLHIISTPEHVQKMMDDDEEPAPTSFLEYLLVSQPRDSQVGLI
jgi:hypothetical protein